MSWCLTKMKKQMLLITVLMVLLVTSVFAEEYSFIFEKDQSAELNIPVFNNNYSTVDDTNVDCYITVKSPTETVLISDQEMFYNDGSYYNYNITASNLSTNGKHHVTVRCNTSNVYGFSTFSFYVTPSGTEPSVAQGVLYSVLLLVLITGLFVSVFTAINIDGKNEFDVGGGLIKVNLNKYYKLGLFFLSYLLLIFIAFVSWQVSVNFLFLNFASTVLNIIHLILWILLGPLFILAVIIGLVKWFLDAKLITMAERGLKVRDPKWR